MSHKTLVGKSQVRTAYLGALREAWQQRRLVLFLGTGVSLPYGVPSWKDLVLDLLCEVGDSKFGRLPPPYRRVVANWVAERFEFSPALLARVARYQISKVNGSVAEKSEAAFRKAVYDALYRNCGAPEPNAALPEIARLIAKGNEHSGVQAVVSFNFDDLLEQELSKHNVDTESVADERRRTGNKFPVLHPNGFLPQHRPEFATPVVLTEDEFHRALISPYSWATTELLGYLRNATVLFIGLSMSDPNLRRLIDAAHVPSEGLVHFLVRQDPRLSKEDLAPAVEEIGRRVDAAGFRDADRQNTKDLNGTIARLCGRAHDYDRKLFKDMGIGVLWVQRFEDVPALLRTISDTR